MRHAAAAAMADDDLIFVTERHRTNRAFKIHRLVF